MPKIQPRYRQSNYDLVLQAYGSIDRLVKFCKDNGVTDINQVLSTEYTTDNNLILNKNVIGYRYATAYMGNIKCNHVNYVTQNGEPYVNQQNVNYVTQCNFDSEPDGEYTYHAYTIAFLDEINSLLGDWTNYISLVDSLNLDNLVRNLVGEENGIFTTVDIWSKLKQFCPIMSSNAIIQSLNLVNLSRNLTFSGSSLINGLNYFKISNVGDFADTGFLDDGVDVPRISMCAGIAFSDFQKNVPDKDSGLIGVFGSNSLYIKVTANPDNKYKGFIYPGDIVTTQDYEQYETLHFNSVPPSGKIYKIDGTQIGIYSVPDFFSNTGLTYTIGKINGFTDADAISKTKFNTSYIGVSLSTNERKSLLNSINFFLYQKGVRNSFTIIS